MKHNKSSSVWMMIVSMLIFGTLGVLREYIPLSSGLIAFVRAVIGGLFLLMIILFRRQHFPLKDIGKNVFFLLLSGSALGFNWVLLFESYEHCSVATATLCYYLAPILVILASPFVLKEKLSRKKLICCAVALLGMVLVSGILKSNSQSLAQWKGILLGLGAAVLYACVILLNKRLTALNAYLKSIAQLLVAAVTMLPYIILTEDIGAIQPTFPTIALLIVAGIVHTGIAYWLYFSSLSQLSAQTAAMFSYIDPITAIILSIVVLRQPMDIPALVGSALILGAAYFGSK